MNIMKYFLVFVLLMTMLNSCTTSSSKNRGSLSNAMDKSRDDFEDERSVPDDDDPWWANDSETDEPDSQDENDPDSNDDSTVNDTDSYLPKESLPMTLLFRGGSSFIAGPYFDHEDNFEVLVGSTFDHWDVYLSGGFTRLSVNKSHSVSESIKDHSFTLTAALEGRYYFFPDFKLFSPYLMGRMGGLYLFWDFQNPLKTEYETIESDILGGLILGTGAGLDFYHGESFRLGVSIIPEVYLFGEETSQGFSNDYFNSQGIIRWAVEGGFTL